MTKEKAELLIIKDSIEELPKNFRDSVYDLKNKAEAILFSSNDNKSRAITILAVTLIGAELSADPDNYGKRNL